MADTRAVQTPEPLPDRPVTRAPAAAGGWPRPAGSWWHTAARLTWVPGLVLMVSAFTDWYVGSGNGLTLSVVGWHTGTLGKLVFFIGLAVVALVVLRETGIELPAMVPESLVVIALGSLATVFVLIRLPVPEEVLPADGRGVGIYISLLASLAVIAVGLLQASEEL
jgi:hypothetical protein